MWMRWKRELGKLDYTLLTMPLELTLINKKTPNNNNNIAEKYNQQEELKENNNSTVMVGRSVAIDIKNKMGMVKDRLMEKLAAASVPSDALENARHYFESMIKDLTSAAQGLTKEALQKIKSHLADILPSLSPSLTSKMVDDSAKETTANTESSDKEGKETEKYEAEEEEEEGKAYASPASSYFSNYLVPHVSKL